MSIYSTYLNVYIYTFFTFRNDIILFSLLAYKILYLYPAPVSILNTQISLLVYIASHPQSHFMVNKNFLCVDLE